MGRAGLIRSTLLALSLTVGAAMAQTGPVEVIAGNLQFPEGTIFVGATPYFVDYSTSSVLRLVNGRVETVWRKPGCGANGLLQVPEGLLVACFDGGTVERISIEGRPQATIARDARGQPFVAPNDLAADPRGGVYFSASGAEGGTPGKIFHIGPDRVVREVANGMSFANGLVVSADGGQLIVAESRRGRLLAFPIRPDGSLGAQRVLVTLSDILADGAHRTYSPDGLRRDRRGNLFVGLYRGGGIAVLSPEARLLAQIDLPGEHHANLALSPDGRSIVATAVDDGPGGSYRGQLLRLANPLPD